MKRCMSAIITSNYGQYLDESLSSIYHLRFFSAITEKKMHGNKIFKILALYWIKLYRLKNLTIWTGRNKKKYLKKHILSDRNAWCFRLL